MEKALFVIKPNTSIGWIGSIAFWYSLLFSLFIALPLFPFFAENTIIKFIALVIFFWWIVYTYQFLTAKYKTYSFYSDKIEYLDSFLIKNKRVIPYEKVTDINQYQGILQRIYGLENIFIANANWKGIFLENITFDEDTIVQIEKIVKWTK